MMDCIATDTSLMENMKPDFDLHIQKSFSFTAFSKFKESTLEFFSDNDDDELNDIKTHKNDDSNNNSFIEISLDHHNYKNDNNNSHLRISFSSSFPSIPETRLSPNSNGTELLPSLCPSLRSSSTGAFRPAPEPFVGSSRRWDPSAGAGQIPAAFNPLVQTLLFSLETHPSPSTPEKSGSDRNEPPFQLAMANADTIIHRKSSKITSTNTTGNRNGIMNKLLTIKFRATKVKKLISALFNKSRSQVNVCYSNKVQNDISYGKKRQKRQKNSKDQHSDKFSHTNDAKNPSYDNQDPRAPEVIGGDRTTIDNNNNYNDRTNNRRKMSSCPNSIKSSPMHQDFGGVGCNINGTALGGENSILSAIAHCKSSLGQSTDFRF